MRCERNACIDASSLYFPCLDHLLYQEKPLESTECSPFGPKTREPGLHRLERDNATIFHFRSKWFVQSFMIEKLRKGTMKIAFVTQRYGGTGGGIERIVEELAKRFCREHEIHVYAQSAVMDEDCPLRFHRIPRYKRSWSVNQTLFFFLSYVYLARTHYDIVHLHAPSLYRRGIVTCHTIPFPGLSALRRLIPELKKMGIQIKQIRRFIITRPIAEYNFKRGKHKRVIAYSSNVRKDLVSICKTPPENISSYRMGWMSNVLGGYRVQGRGSRF